MACKGRSKKVARDVLKEFELRGVLTDVCKEFRDVEVKQTPGI